METWSSQVYGNSLENCRSERVREFESHRFYQHMVLVVKRLRPRIVIPIYVGSIPIKHPRQLNSIAANAAPSYGVYHRFESDFNYQARLVKKYNTPLIRVNQRSVTSTGYQIYWGLVKWYNIGF